MEILRGETTPAIRALALGLQGNIDMKSPSVEDDRLSYSGTCQQMTLNYRKALTTSAKYVTLRLLSCTSAKGVEPASLHMNQV